MGDFVGAGDSSEAEAASQRHPVSDAMFLTSGFFSETSISLLQHRCVRLLWLSLSYCIHMTGTRLYSTRHSMLPNSRRASFSAMADAPNGSSGAHQRMPSSGGSGLSSTGNSLAGNGWRRSGGLQVTGGGYEAALRSCVERYGEMRVSSLASSFPKGCEPLCSSEAFLRFLVNSDLGTSQWEHMESFRAMQVVVVLFNCSDELNISVKEGLTLIQSVFSANFRDKVCRCVVVNIPEEEKNHSLLQLGTFLCVDSRTPISQTADALMRSVAGSFVYQACVTMQSLGNSTGRVPEPLQPPVRTPLDFGNSSSSSSSSAGDVGLRPAVLQSRLRKKRSDLLLQLGAAQLALASYGETQFGSNVDATWCSATLEGIAAGRLLQMQPLLRWRTVAAEMLVKLQSDATTWDSSVASFLQGTLLTLQQAASQVAECIALYKNGSVPYSMRSRLSKEVSDVLAAKVAALKEMMPRLEACVAAGTPEDSGDPRNYTVAAELKRLIEEALGTALSEIYVYLNESLRQLRHAYQNISAAATAANNVTPTQREKLLGLLRDREMETRLKMLSFTAIIGCREKFSDELTFVHGLAEKVFSEDRMVELHHFFFSLCLQNKCFRYAVAYLLSASSLEVKLGSPDKAMKSLVKACFYAGVPLCVPELADDVPYSRLFRYFTRLTARKSPCSTASYPGAADDEDHDELPASNTNGEDDAAPVKFLEEAGTRQDHGSSKEWDAQRLSETRPYHVPLLLRLLDLLQDSGPACRGSVCRLSFFILLRYAPFLTRASQESLRDTALETLSGLAPCQEAAPVDLPLITQWEAMPLPPHLAPKTVPVGGPVFTFIDTQRLKLTCLSLNGRRLNSSVVWTVGDAGTVQITVQNPFRFPLFIDYLALQCYSVCEETPPLPRQRETPSPSARQQTDEAADGNAREASAAAAPVETPAQTVEYRTGPNAPISYALAPVELQPLEKRTLLLEVHPVVPGQIKMDGVVCSALGVTSSAPPLTIRFPRAMTVPVLPRLPLVSCTISVSEVEIFSGQSVSFSVRVANCGRVPIEHISLTAHSESCQMEGCEGCKERLSNKDSAVTLGKAALAAATRAPLHPGDVVIVPVTLHAPPAITEMGAHFIVFRVDCSLPHEKPTMPPNVPDSIPVFGVTPRRVTETRMRLFHAPSLSLASVELTRDKRFVSVRVMNRSQRYSVSLRLSALRFTNLPDAMLVPGAEFTVPNIAITSIPVEDAVVYQVPWSIRELPDCTGFLRLDFSVVAKGAIYAEPLDDCVVSADFDLPPSVAAEGYLPQRHWESDRPGESATRRQRRNHRQHRRQHRRRHRRSSSTSRSGSTATTSRSSSSSSSRSDSSGRHNGRASSRSSSASSAFLRRQEDNQCPAATEMSDAVPQALPIIIPAVKAVRLKLRVKSAWRRAVPLRIQVEMDNFFDTGILSGPVDTEALVGAGGQARYEREFELFTFKTGEHAVTVRITDSSSREITHVIPLVVQYGLGLKNDDGDD